MAEKTGKTRKSAADKIISLPIGEIRPYKKNPRKNAKAVKYVKASIEKFGFKQPIIVDSNRVIIAGHTRLEAAKSLGMAEVPCIVADDLTDAQVKALRLADNKVSEFAEWDLDLLGGELGELADISDIDMGDFGFDLSEFDNIGMDAEEKEVVEDEVPEEVEPVCKKGDLWQLGEHSLMCGDSTNAEDFAKLMDGTKADLSFTSPPYNAGCLDLDGRENTKRKYMNDADQKTDEQYLAFLSSNVNLLLKHSDEVFYNIGVVAGSKIAILGLLYEYRNKFKDFIYWKKSNPVNCIAKGVISSAVELIMCFGENNSRAFKDTHFQNGEYYLGVIEGNVASNNEYAKIHKATFPMYLPENIINNFSSQGSVILDCFGGTGTTMIACEQLGRKCRMMELDPHYCDVILKRYINFKGSDADVFLLKDGKKIPYSEAL